MKDTIVAYIAGVMDSDGYFTVRRNTYNIRIMKDSKNPNYYERVGIKQVKKEAIELIHNFFGGYLHIEKPQAPNRKPLYALQITNRKAHYFVKTIYPFLRIKRKQAEVLFELRNSINKGRTKKSKTTHTEKSGKIKTVTRYSVSVKEIKIREMLYHKMKELNDSRNDIKHQPLPY